MDDFDARIAAALDSRSPPERDPLFRLDYLRRREERAFRARLLWATALFLGLALALSVCQALFGSDSLEITVILVCGAGAALFGLVVIPVMPSILARLRFR
jgi:hypothetical protein